MRHRNAICLILLSAAVPLAASAAREEASKPAVKPETVLVPAGAFVMGTPNGVRYGSPDEKPQRSVTLKAFRIDRFEVTNREYRLFLQAIDRIHPTTCHASEGAGKSHEPEAKYWNDPEWSSPEKPVIGVDWYDAYAYCAWAGKRLPTEAEWEKAARGEDARKYPWGDEFPQEGLVGNFADEAALRLEPDWTVIRGYDDRFPHTAPVGSFPKGASPYGAEDMAGNTWEWVQDIHSPMAYSTLPDVDPTGPAEGPHRVMRGGSWDSTPNFIRTTARRAHFPTYRGISSGFRCARDVP